ncbi:MAG: hypothetical protein QF570_14175 [Myxococcota bacterium]|jgi:hypothetical protein|nr:hypothetical protein [Myxococcota bacterium]
MRLMIISLALGLLVATSAGAVQKPNRGQCRRIAKQLEVHAASVEMAKQRGNAAWASATLQQMARLDERRERLCPDLYPQGSRARAMAEMAEFLKNAGRTALSLLTFGAF